jgi:glycogen operon protein
MILNAHHDVVAFTLPEVPGGREWRLLIDTNLSDEDTASEPAFAFEHPYSVTGRSLLLFELVLDPSYGVARTKRRAVHVPPRRVEAHQSLAVTLAIAEAEMAAEEA